MNNTNPLKSLIENGLLWSPDGAELPPALSSPNTTVSQLGIAELDSTLPGGGFALGAIHQFHCEYTRNKRSPSFSYLPHSLLAKLVGGVLRHRFSELFVGEDERAFQERLRRYFSLREEVLLPYWVVWIGRELWPTPSLLSLTLDCSFHQVLSEKELQKIHQSYPSAPHSLRFSRNCLFLDPQSDEELLLALETALQSAATAAVIAAPRKLSFALSRRFALLAREHQICTLFIRPLEESFSPSLALTSWQVKPFANSQQWQKKIQRVERDFQVCWQLDLLKSRGTKPQQTRWIIAQERDDETLSFNIFSGLEYNRSSLRGSKREEKQRNEKTLFREKKPSRAA